MNNSNMRFLLAFLFFFIYNQCVTAKVFTRCGLVKELEKHDFPKSQMVDWVCLIEAESGRNTSAKGGPNRNRSYDWGLFQINDGLWCSTETAGKDCKVKCSDLVKSDITESVKCAKKIYKRHGFNAWYGWKNKCKKNLPDVSKC